MFPEQKPEISTVTAQETKSVFIFYDQEFKVEQGYILQQQTM